MQMDKEKSASEFDFCAYHYGRKSSPKNGTRVDYIESQ